MHSRRDRVQEKRSTRAGILFLIGSAILVILLAKYGLRLLPNILDKASGFKTTQQVVTSTDKTPPGPPSLDINSNFSTKEETFVFKGKAETDSKVSLYKNGALSQEKQISDNSLFEFSVNLEKGPNSLAVTATDQFGNTSEKSTMLIVTFDSDPPNLEITQPQDKKEFFSQDKNISVEGSTDPESKVTINDRVTIVSSEGKFSIRISLNEGQNNLLITSTDLAGNKSEKTLTVSYSP